MSCILQKAKRSSGSARQLIVVGNGAGEVAAFDTVLGEEIWRVSDCHQGQVSRVIMTLVCMRCAHICSTRHACTESCDAAGYPAQDDLLTLFYLRQKCMKINITSDKLKLPIPCCPHQCLHDMREFYTCLKAVIPDRHVMLARNRVILQECYRSSWGRSRQSPHL